MQEWHNFTTLEKCIAVLLVAGAGAIGVTVFWAAAVIAACM